MKLRQVLVSILAASLIFSGLMLTASTNKASGAGVSSPAWMANATVYEVNVRQYTKEGTFNAFATHLDRLKALGVKVLWFMPVQPISVKNRKGTLGSYYSVADYTGINSEFGTASDFKALVDKAHSMGFKVVLDWVANHTGWDNPWIKSHPDWYTKDASGNITWPPGTDWTDVADLNYDNAAMRAAMIDSMRYWVTNYNIDGFRCDYASGVPNDFWWTATQTLSAIKPLWFLAEANAGDVRLGESFTSTYNWPLLSKFNNMNIQVTNKNDIAEAAATISTVFPKGTYPMNFITNHDENSWSGTEYSRLGGVPQVKAGAVLEFTLPGVPLLYTGQEVGMNKMLKFFEKDQVDYPATPSPMTAFYKRLVQLKTQSPALAVGTTAGALASVDTNKDSVAAYARASGKARTLVAVNLSGKAVSVKISWAKYSGNYFDLSSNKSVKLATSQTLALPAWGYEVLTTNLIAK